MFCQKIEAPKESKPMIVAFNLSIMRNFNYSAWWKSIADMASNMSLHKPVWYSFFQNKFNRD